MTQTAIATVEEVVRSFGLSPSECRFDTRDGSTAWSVGGERAEVLIFVNPPAHRDAPEMVRMVSPVWRPPPRVQAEAWKRLLELNATDLVGAAFAFMNDVVLIVAERPTTELTPQAVDFMLRAVGSSADHFQEELVRRFGGSAP